MKYVVVGLIVALLILHQDIWFWENGTLLFGFMPIGLLYHAGISISAAITWYLATQFCWPSHVEEETLAAVGEASETSSKGGSDA